jgi:pyrroline-5-carboxylate reductase
LEALFLENEIMQTKLKIGFIGAGNMASALIKGIQQQHATFVHVVDVNEAALSNWEQEFAATSSTEISQQFAPLDAIVLAVKPQQLQLVAKQLAPFLKQQVIVSVAAGIRTQDLSRWLNGYQNIVRAMPNTPAMIGLGMTGLYAMESVTSDQRQLAQTLMAAVGSTLWVEQESQIDAITAMSGSGPAYVFYFLEAMQAAGVQLGFSEAQAKQLALATFQGATQLAQRSPEDLHELRARVTSKGGTTYAGLSSMEQSDVKTAIVKAIAAANARAKELGDEFGVLN